MPRKQYIFGGAELLARSLPALLKLRSKLHPDKVFIQIWSHVGGLQRTVTYQEMYDQVCELKGALANLGVGPGTRVALLSHNNVEYLMAGLALMSLRAVPVQLNWRQPLNLLEETVRLARCRLVFASKHFMESAEAICKTLKLRNPLDLVRFGQNAYTDDDVGGGGEDLGGGGGGGENEESVVGEQMAVVFFTSGSTKTPKAVPHTHYELMWLAHQYVVHLDKGEADEDGGSLCLFPFFHVMGYVHNFLYNLYAGMRVVIHAETADTAINPELMLRAMKELKPTIVNTVPWVVEGFCQKLQDKDPTVQCVKELRYISYGGAALPDYCRKILEAHKVKAMMSYGQTELGAAIMFTVPGGSLEYMQLLPGVSYELESEDGGAEVAARNEGRTGELVLLNQYSTTKAYLPGSNARPLAKPGTTTYQRYYTGDVFEEKITPDGMHLLAYRCRHDDLVVHKTGEMSHPIPTEQSILTDTSSFVNNLCYFGQGRTAALLAVELTQGALPEEVAGDVWKAIDKANAAQPSYSAVTHNAVILVQPEIHGPLPTTNKGNVQRLKVERRFEKDFTAENPSVHESRGVALADVLNEDLLSQLDDQEMDSLDFTSAWKGKIPPFMVKQYHAYFIAMVGIIAMHMCGARGEEQFAPFLVNAGVKPAFLRGLPRGAQIFALPVFIILMGISDYKGLGKPGKGTLLSRAWRDLGRPLLLFLVCKYVLPAIAGALLHPYYGAGKGGHVTFNWIFLFMVYARFVSQLVVRGCRLPRWAPAVLALVLHFGCYGGAEMCPSPFARSYKLVGFLPKFLNCPRFSVYYPFYAVAPLCISEAMLLSPRLAGKAVRVVAAIAFAVIVLWAMGSFNIDTTYMAMQGYGCRGEGKKCVATWEIPAFVEDLGALALSTLATFTLLVACSTKPSFASAVGQRSLVALIVHLYAIYVLNPPLQIVCKWMGKSITPVVLPALAALVLCTAVQIVCCVPLAFTGSLTSDGSSGWLPKSVSIVSEVRIQAIVSFVLVAFLVVVGVIKG